MARKKSHPAPPSPIQLSGRKRRIFRLLVLCLPLVLLTLVEAGLRLYGLGGYAPMLQRVGEVDGGTLIIADQGGASSWFFASPSRAGSTEQYAFLDPKPVNTVRIFFVGASAIEGYPQPRHLASSAFFQAMLQDAWPHRKIEVINLGATAIASFPVLGIMTEALNYEPDLIVVHTGHNEFFGTYGVASSGRAGSRPWMLKANRLIHSFAFMQGLGMLLDPDAQPRNRTLMEAMIGQQHIGANDRRREAAARNLHHNVTQMIQRCQAAQVPIIVCTQPTNEKDLAPIGTDQLEGLSRADQSDVEDVLAMAEKATTNTLSATESALRRIIKQVPTHARAHYLLGRTLMQAQHQAVALEQFTKARDLDPMPWRIPTLSQESVTRAAAENGVPVCDLVEAFRSASPERIIGWELMDDHVHPTVRGQALTAETLLDCLTYFQGQLRVSPEALENVAPWTEYATQLHENIFDHYAVAHTMRILFAAPFLRESNPLAYERFDTLAEEIESRMPAEVTEVLREWQETRPYAGSRCPITAAVAQLLLKQDNYATALDLYEIALSSVPEYTSWNLEYVYYSLVCRQRLNNGLSAEELERAHSAIEQGKFLCEKLDSATGFNERYTGLLYLLCREFEEAIPFLEASSSKVSGLDRLAVDQALIVCCLGAGRFEEARQVAARGVARSGEYTSRYEALLKELPALVESARESRQSMTSGSE